MHVSFSRGSSRSGSILDALGQSRSTLLAVGIFSSVLNVLALTGSIYMLQIYDRVLPSRSIPTLIGLTIIMAGLYVGFGILDLVRTLMMSRIG